MYNLRLAASPGEDLEAIRLFGNGIYGFPLEKLAELKTREALAAAGLRMAQREGHCVVAVTPCGKIAAASRITPSPQGVRDPCTGEVEHWETVAVHPDHRGKGISLPLRKAALDSSDAVVIKSRIKEANPRSWQVAEQLGFDRVDTDGSERIYVMRRPHLSKRANWLTPVYSGVAGAGIGAAAGAALQDDRYNGAGDGAVIGGLTGLGAGLGHLAGSYFNPGDGSSATPAMLGAAGLGIGGYLLGQELRRRKRLEQQQSLRNVPHIISRKP